MTKLISQISAIAPLEQAIDGTRKPKRVVVTRKPPPPAGSSRWLCPICGRKAHSAEDQARHVGYEASRLRKALVAAIPDAGEKYSPEWHTPGAVTQAERDRIAQLHAEGLGRNEIAWRLRRSGKAVSRVAADLGLSFSGADPGQIRPVTQTDYDRVRQLHAQGASRNQIARELSRSGKTISRIAAELNLTFERGGRTRAATEARKADARSARTAGRRRPV